MTETDSGFELVELKGGARSIRSLRHGETMHVGSDPVTEASLLHVGQLGIAGMAASWKNPSPLVLWDVGLGPAANALAVLDALEGITFPEVGQGTAVELHSFEIATEVLEFALGHARALGYLAGREALLRELLEHGVCRPIEGVLWKLHRGDFSKGHGDAPAPAAVMFDPYSPVRNPEMWNMETFGRLREAAFPGGCVLSNYTRSTSVRVTMLLAGWHVGRGIATGEKEETTVAATRSDLLADPLGQSWLSRVRSSTNAAPLRGRNPSRSPIAEEDYGLLASHPQFR